MHYRTTHVKCLFLIIFFPLIYFIFSLIPCVLYHIIFHLRQLHLLLYNLFFLLSSSIFDHLIPPLYHLISNLFSSFITTSKSKDDVDDADDAVLELESASATDNNSMKTELRDDQLSVALAAVPSAPLRFSESVNGSRVVSVSTGQISTNGLMIINENGEEERRTVTAIFAGAERCRRLEQKRGECVLTFTIIFILIIIFLLSSLLHFLKPDDGEEVHLVFPHNYFGLILSFLFQSTFPSNTFSSIAVSTHTIILSIPSLLPPFFSSTHLPLLSYNPHHLVLLLPPPSVYISLSLSLSISLFPPISFSLSLFISLSDSVSVSQSLSLSLFFIFFNT